LCLALVANIPLTLPEFLLAGLAIGTTATSATQPPTPKAGATYVATPVAMCMTFAR